MMPEPYEDLVKEYLELEGYFVKQNVRYGEKNHELDILAVKLHPREILLAEVSANYPTKVKVDKIKSKLLNEELSKSIENEVGKGDFKRMLFYWLNTGARMQKARIENQLGRDIQPVSLQEVVTSLRKKANEGKILYFREKPFLTLLQLLP